MSNRLPLLVLLVVLAAGIGGGLWYALRADASVTGALDLEQPLEVSESTAADAPMVAPADALAERGERSTVTESPGVARDESFDLADARWVEVRIAAPANSPPDDSLAVLSLVVPEQESDGDELSDEVRSFRRTLARNTNARELRDQALETEGEVRWAWREVDAEGVARVPFPADAQRGTLVLDAKYLYLPEGHVVDFEAGTREVVLEPELGAWLTGSCVLPPGAAERGVEPGTLAVEIQFEGLNFFGGRSATPRQSSRKVELDGETEFELRGMSTDVRFVVAADADGLANYQDVGLRLEPGEHRVYELAFALGGVVAGRVADEEGAGVAEAQVQLSGGRNINFFGRTLEGEETGAEGSYVIAGVPAGKYTARTHPSGWTEAKSDEFEIADGERIEGIDLVLARGNGIAGTVAWPDGRPAEGATVGVSKKQVGSRGGDWGASRVVANGIADDKGAFSVNGLAEGPFLVTARVNEVDSETSVIPDSLDEHQEVARGDPRVWRASARDVPANTSNLVLVVEEPEVLAGFVQDEAGVPLTEFEVTAAQVTGEETPWAPANEISDEFESEDGSFALDRLYPGEWKVRASAEGYTYTDEPVPITIPYTGAPIALTLSHSASVTGLVVDPGGNPVAGARIEDSTGSGQQRGMGMMFGGGRRGNVETDESGRFTLENLSVGGHSLIAHADDWAASEPLTVDLVPAQVLEEIVLTLRVGGRITGEVYDEAGAPMSGRRVSYGANPMGFGFGGNDSVTTDGSGRFAFDHVTPGKWTVTASPGEDELFDMFANARDESAMLDFISQTLTEKVEVADGEEVHVSLGAEPKAPVRIHGRITKSGEPVASATVFAVAEGGALMTGFKMQRANEDGTYEVTVDRPGAYVLGVEAGGGRQIDFPIDVPEAEEFRYDLAVPLGAIRGTVYAPDGSPEGGVELTLTPEGGGFAISNLGGGNRVTSDADGSYAFESLWAGSYSVRSGGSRAFGFGGTSPYGSQVVGGIVVDADETVEGVDLRLSGAGRIEGVVRDTAGEPVAGATIFVRDEAGRLLSYLSTVTSDAAGRFTFGGISPGTVTVSARGDQVACSDSDSIQVSEGEASEVKLTLETGTTLVVTVVDGEGEPLRAGIRVFDENDFEVGGMYSMESVQAAFSEGISTKEQRVGPLPAGKYRVVATARDGREAKKPVTLKGQEERKLKIRLKD